MASYSAPTLPDSLAAVARDRGSHAAIREDGRELDYASVDAAATAIAAHALAATSGARGRICLLYERRIEAFPALFGAMRAGGDAAPLDVEDPDERLRAIVAIAAPVAILAERATLERARSIAPPGCAVIDTTSLPPQAPAIALPAIGPDDLALCQFTSGSTGTPKGVLQAHRNLVRYLELYTGMFDADATDRHSWLSKLSFSASVPAGLGMVMVGGTSVCYDIRRQGLRGLADWFDREGITILHVPVLALREMLDGLPPDRRLSGVRAIHAAGQPLFDADLERLRRHFREDLLVVYRLASTEHNMTTFHRFVPREAHTRGGVLPVGKPPPGTRIEILRDDGTPAGVDEPGEVVIHCAYVAAGYLGSGAAEQGAITADPLDPTKRRFRPGDLGRLDADGSLTLLGRRGSRVRIHGHSVDLIEVEAALAQCAGIRELAVVVPEREPDRLVAYVVPMDGATVSAVSLRRELATRLPRYMLPGAFVFLDAIPANRNGKADRAALAARETRVVRAGPPVPPRDDLERAIASILEDMLAVSPVGRDDDFFLLGGDSLALEELQSRIAETCGATLAKFDDDTTVAGIAAQVRRERAAAKPAGGPASVLVLCRSGGDAPPLFLVHGRLGQAPVSPRLLRILGDDQPVWGIRARGLDGSSMPHDTVEAMARDYLAEIRKVRPQGPYFLGSLCAGALVVVEIARRLVRQGQPVLPLLFIDPPAEHVWISEAFLTEEGVTARLRKLQAQGSDDIALDDEAYVQASVRTAIAFERAIARHQPRGYPGPVFVLASGGRSNRISLDILRRLYPMAERAEFGGRHATMLDPDNPRLVQEIRGFLARVRAQAATMRAAEQSAT